MLIICSFWSNTECSRNHMFYEFDLFVLIKKSSANNVRGKAKWTNQYLCLYFVSIFVSICCINIYINILYQYLYQNFVSIFVQMKKSGGNNKRGEAKWTNQEKHLSREKTKRSNLCKNCKKERKTSKVYLSLSKKWK